MTTDALRAGNEAVETITSAFADAAEAGIELDVEGSEDLQAAAKTLEKMPPEYKVKLGLTEDADAQGILKFFEDQAGGVQQQNPFTAFIQNAAQATQGVIQSVQGKLGKIVSQTPIGGIISGASKIGSWIGSNLNKTPVGQQGDQNITLEFNEPDPSPVQKVYEGIKSAIEGNPVTVFFKTMMEGEGETETNPFEPKSNITVAPPIC